MGILGEAIEKSHLFSIQQALSLCERECWGCFQDQDCTLPSDFYRGLALDLWHPRRRRQREDSL